MSSKGFTRTQKIALLAIIIPSIIAISGWFLLPLIKIKVKEWTATKSPTTFTPTNVETMIQTPGGVSVASLSPTSQNIKLETSSPYSTTIAISEIMANPCGIIYKNQNEYVELYNYGDFPIDVVGWYLATTLEDGLPDELVSWKFRNDYSLGTDVIINSTVINPHQFAVILSPYYHLSTDEPIMPYRFPPDTIILTIKNGDNLGNKTFGIRGAIETTQIEGIYLFMGRSDFIDKVISTYGVEIMGTSPSSQSKLRSGLPIGTQSCYSVQRKIVDGPDIATDWETVKYGNPGDGPYN